MMSYSLSHLADRTLLRDLAVLVSQDRATTAALLAHLAEVDERRLYLPAAHSSMYSYCVHELRMSTETAFRRIRVARTARQFPDMFAAPADGRLNLTAVLLLAPHLAADTCDELLSVAAHKSKGEIEWWLAGRFPRPDLPTLVQAIAAPAAGGEPAVRPVAPAVESNHDGLMEPLAPEPVARSCEPDPPMLTAPLGALPEITPLSAGRFTLQVTVHERTHELLRYAQALLGHSIPSGNVAEVLERALEALVEKLEQQKFAAAARSRPRRGAPRGRYVPADVRRTVWQRDGGRCTFVSEGGKRCEERTRLEFDHVDPVARGGETAVNHMRLRCRAHNQYSAECTFGAAFMRGKREQARSRAQPEGPLKPHAAAAEDPAKAADVTPWLRALGFNAITARRGAELCSHLPDAPLEERVKITLRGLAPAHVRRPAYSGG